MMTATAAIVTTLSPARCPASFKTGARSLTPRLPVVYFSTSWFTIESGVANLGMPSPIHCAERSMKAGSPCK